MNTPNPVLAGRFLMAVEAWVKKQENKKEDEKDADAIIADHIDCPPGTGDSGLGRLGLFDTTRTPVPDELGGGLQVGSGVVR